MQKFILVILLFLSVTFTYAQKFTKQDSLRGSITKERAWWDLKHYDLNVEVFPEKQFIKGTNTIHYKVLQPNTVMQIDLQKPMSITKITQGGKILTYKQIGNAYFIHLNKKQQIGETNCLTIYYEGKPRVAKKPPWDAVFTWEKDSVGNHFIATSCQGEGASMWWPCKDHMYDEAESMDIKVTAPKNLINVSNGKLVKVKETSKNKKTWHWQVKNPINNYGVNVNIANYKHFSEIYEGLKGDLQVDYYVLEENFEKAKKQFKDAPKMLRAFEHWFGPYPFYEDGFKLVEVPYLGMEHQSSVTYGNGYKNGYLGNDLSGTGWGLTFDFIIIHEGGHEWFANNITNKDIADMWIHESFTSYAESLFVEYYYGKDAGAEYVVGTRQKILNDKPIIGIYNVNVAGSTDMYYKGANMLHTLRQLVEDDKLWHNLMLGLNKDFYHQTVTTQQIENYISKFTKKDLTAFFNQYLRTTKIPTLEFKILNNNLVYRWNNIVEDFDMPIKVKINNTEKWLFPSEKWENLNVNKPIYFFEVDVNFYITTKQLN